MFSLLLFDEYDALTSFYNNYSHLDNSIDVQESPFCEGNSYKDKY